MARRTGDVLRAAAAGPLVRRPTGRGYQQGYQQRPYTKKKSFLSELFDD